MTAPHEDETRGLAGGAGFEEQDKMDQCHSRTAPNAREALRAIEGEDKARAYLAGLQAQEADPDELALIVAALYGAALRGFCRLIAKALGLHHA